MSEKSLKKTGFLVDVLQPDRMTRIVDIGANPINHNPYEELLNSGFAEVYGFEPQPSAFEALQANPKPNQTVFPYAVGNGETSMLNIYRSSGFTSLLEANPELFDYLGRWKRKVQLIDQIEVKTIRLDDIQELPEFDLLKIDIQGAEKTVFENGANKLSSALAVCTEVAAVPLYKDQPLLDEQMRVLRDHGFHLHKFDFFTRMPLLGKYSGRLRGGRNLNQLIDGDAIFIKSLLALDSLTIEQLKHMAILADSMFKSLDLAVRILEILEARGAVAEADINAYIDLH